MFSSYVRTGQTGRECPLTPVSMTDSLIPSQSSRSFRVAAVLVVHEGERETGKRALVFDFNQSTPNSDWNRGRRKRKHSSNQKYYQIHCMIHPLASTSINYCPNDIGRISTYLVFNFLWITRSYSSRIGINCRTRRVAYRHIEAFG